MYGFESNSFNTINTYTRYISGYLEWCCEKGYSNDNPLRQLKSDDFLNYLTNKDNYYSRDDFENWQKGLKNYQEMAVSELIFHGVGGKNFSEIRNLKISDINEGNNLIRLMNTLNPDKPDEYILRYIKVEDRTIEIIKKAFHEANDVVRNEFVIHERGWINTRMVINKVSAKCIQRSGMIYCAKELIGDGELTKVLMSILS